MFYNTVYVHNENIINLNNIYFKVNCILFIKLFNSSIIKKEVRVNVKDVDIIIVPN